MHLSSPDWTRLVTIAVVPRENFSLAQRSLESIATHTPVEVPIVYVDGASPLDTAAAITALAARRSIRHLRTRRFVSPNAARNIAMRHIKTPYVVFVDNNIVVEPGWLEALVRCAEETGAAIVGPLCLIEVAGTRRVHLTGGTLEITVQDGMRVCLEQHRDADAVPQVGHARVRERTALAEFHTMLARTAFVRRHGPLDEALLSLHEHVDLCLIAARDGEAVYFEPASVVTYLTSDRMTFHDKLYFRLRWSERWNALTVDRFAAKWSLNRDAQANVAVLGFARRLRQRALRCRRNSGERAATEIHATRRAAQ